MTAGEEFVARLRAQIDADEQMAVQTGETGPWTEDRGEVWGHGQGDVAAPSAGRRRGGRRVDGRRRAPARWSPARVLAECDARRAVIDLFPVARPSSDPDGRFLGMAGTRCEHRTVGSHRAWCHVCSEWCYPTSAAPAAATPCRTTRCSRWHSRTPTGPGGAPSGAPPPRRPHTAFTMGRPQRRKDPAP